MLQIESICEKACILFQALNMADTFLASWLEESTSDRLLKMESICFISKTLTGSTYE